MNGGHAIHRISIQVRVLDGLLDTHLGEALDLMLQSHVELDVLHLHLGGIRVLGGRLGGVGCVPLFLQKVPIDLLAVGDEEES